jgi:hypothetical protein
VLCSPAFLLVSALGSTGSAAGRPALFVGFTATMAESDFPRSCIIGFDSSPSRCGPEQHALRSLRVGRGTSRFPYKKLKARLTHCVLPPGGRRGRDRAFARSRSRGTTFTLAQRVSETGPCSFNAASIVCGHPPIESRLTALAISITQPRRCWIERLQKRLDRRCPRVCRLRPEANGAYSGHGFGPGVGSTVAAGDGDGRRLCLEWPDL